MLRFLDLFNDTIGVLLFAAYLNLGVWYLNR